MKNDRINGTASVAGTGSGGGGGGDIIMPPFNDANIGVHGIQTSGLLGSVDIQIDALKTVKGTSADGLIGTIAVPSDAEILSTGIGSTGFIGTATVPANFIYLDSIFPSTTVAGNTIEIRFMGIGFDTPNLQINVSGKGVAVTTISNVTYYSFSAIFRVDSGNNGVGRHAVTVQTDVGISGGKDLIVSPRK